MEECEHPIQVAGLCALCGKEIDEEAFGEQTFATLHSSASVKVSRAEAERIDRETTSRLLEQRKLALIVDLDQTIIHVTVDPTVREWAQDPSNPNWDALSDIVAFQLGADGKTLSHSPEKLHKEHANTFATQGDEDGCWYFVKLRPGLSDFLASLAERFELHVYTMGTRSYADCICQIVDPTGKLFGARILSRDENESIAQKSLARLFPINTSMVVIIDDRADVWSWSANLIKVDPYEFFVGIGDINAGHLGPNSQPDGIKPLDTTPGTPLAEQQQQTIHEQVDSRPLAKLQEQKKTGQSDDSDKLEAVKGTEAVLRDDDSHLDLVQSLLARIHTEWYSAHDQNKDPDVSEIISSMKRLVLKDCVLVFSSLIPLNEQPEKTSEEFGAKCRREIGSDVTHMVTASAGTAKAEDAFRHGRIHVVYPGWLNDSICQWERKPEGVYMVPRSERLANLDQDALDNLATSFHADADNQDETALDGLVNMDWNEAEDEVDAFLDEDDEDDPGSELSESFQSEDDQDLLASTSSFNKDDPPIQLDTEQLRSPLSRRRHAVASREGQSKLRHSIIATDDSSLSASEDEQLAVSPKRRKIQDKISMLRSQSSQTNSEDEHFLDDLASEMEKELEGDE
ncbi:protein-serine/threonine phosphatase [Malassezia yamatoensis]|uniref:RNA polymerase II subunit A C-terminal domain phosphatase n=1 Tax=Malassezia yamatoensis TaxID=253288 RepID=A0AAJ5YXW5_9BASI|nr:protein-serine/threonine phosphatase [Malassezia yamatoensis]